MPTKPPKAAAELDRIYTELGQDNGKSLPFRDAVLNAARRHGFEPPDADQPTLDQCWLALDWLVETAKLAREQREQLLKLSLEQASFGWQTPRNAPPDNTFVRVWDADAGDSGWELEHVCFVKRDAKGQPRFVAMGGGYISATLWRLEPDGPSDPSDELVAQSHAEFEEDDK